jgi:hypothetical protein
MLRHLSPEIVERFATRQLPPNELLETAQHLTLCEECRTKVREAERVRTTTEFIRDDLQREPLTHLSYEQLAGYVDEALNRVDRDIVTNHLAYCTVCANEIRELSLLRDSLSTYPQAIQPESIQPNFWQRLAAFFSLKQARVAAASLALLLIAVAVFFLIKPAKEQMIATSTKTDEPAKPAPDGNSKSLAGTESVPNESEKAGKSLSIVQMSLPPAYKKIVNQALTEGRITAPAAIRELSGKQSNLMSRKESNTPFALLAPVGTVIQSSRPTLRWKPLSGTSHYKVFILDENFNLVQESKELSTTAWQTTEPLKRGSVYLWEVTAIVDGKEITAPAAPMPEARFKILDSTKAKELEELKQHGNLPHLILGTIYAHNGLLEDAERELQLAASEKQDTAVARKLLQCLKRIRQ